MPERKVIYLKHPVSAEEKKRLVSQGYKIIDARFKPKDLQPEPAPEPAVEKPKPVRRRTRKSKNAN